MILQVTVTSNLPDRAAQANQRSYTIIVPAYNEELWLPQTLPPIAAAAANLLANCGLRTEIIVVDDASTDRTAAVASECGAKVVQGPGRGIGAARNAGARASSGDYLVFIDADTLITDDLLMLIEASVVSGLEAGAVPGRYETDRRAVQLLFRLWKWYGSRQNMAQGVCQVFSKSLFVRLEGYDEELRHAEDTDLFWRARDCVIADAAKKVTILHNAEVYPSMRRYAAWSATKIWVRTNPVTTRLMLRSTRFWNEWYDNPPR